MCPLTNVSIKFFDLLMMILMMMLMMILAAVWPLEQRHPLPWTSPRRVSSHQCRWAMLSQYEIITIAIIYPDGPRPNYYHCHHPLSQHNRPAQSSESSITMITISDRGVSLPLALRLLQAVLLQAPLTGPQVANRAANVRNIWDILQWKFSLPQDKIS